MGAHEPLKMSSHALIILKSGLKNFIVIYYYVLLLIMQNLQYMKILQEDLSRCLLNINTITVLKVIQIRIQDFS